MIEAERAARMWTSEKSWASLRGVLFEPCECWRVLDYRSQKGRDLKTGEGAAGWRIIEETWVGGLRSWWWTGAGTARSGNRRTAAGDEQTEVLKINFRSPPITKEPPAFPELPSAILPCCIVQVRAEEPKQKRVVPRQLTSGVTRWWPQRKPEGSQFYAWAFLLGAK